MSIQRSITRFVAVSLSILLLASTAPVSAAELTAPANIGSVSAVGSVQLRGVSVSEGTLFSGDRLNVAPGSYAKVVLGAGSKVELDGNTNVTLSKDADAISIQMTSGNLAFTGSQKPVRVRVGNFEVTAAGQTRGSVAFVGTDAFGVRVMEGSVNVRNTTTKESYSVTKGSDRIISLNAASGKSSVQLASSVPSSIPAAPAMPAPRALSGTGKALLIASVLGTGAAIAVLMTKNDDSDTDAAARLAKTKALSNIAAIQATAAQVATTEATITTTATAAQNAINALPATSTAKAGLLSQASTLISQANATGATITSLNTQISALQNQINSQGTGPTSAQTQQLNSLLDQLNTARQQANTQIGLLNTLLSSAQQNNVTGLPNNPNLQQISGPTVSSASLPD